MSALLALLAASAIRPQGDIWKDPSKPLPARVDDLVGKMTLDEKISQMQNSAAPIPRLGIPGYNWWSEGLHGVGLAGLATSFPQSIGLAATFDTDLMTTIATVISDEARAKHQEAVRKNNGDSPIFQGLTFWSPNINIFRDPRWGRGQETYGEDPYLTSRMGVAFVRAMQGDDPRYFKVIATPKHYAVHSGPDPQRHVFNVLPRERDLWLTYLPAFKACVQEGGAWSVMSAYNRVNGLPVSANPTLLQEILRDRWGFKGYVVSDCGAIDDIYRGHKTVATAAEASAIAVKAGCDVECGESYKALHSAVDQGLIDEATIDKSVKRLMEARFRLGMFDPDDQVPYTKIPMSVVDSSAHRTLARKAAEESIVLLKNEGMLPLRKGLGTIAVIGPNADAPGTLLGNYNGVPSHVVTPLEGIRKAVGPGTKVIYARGSGITSATDLSSIPTASLRTPDGKPGLLGEYFKGRDLTGSPALTRVDDKIDFDWANDAPAPSLPATDFSVRWHGKLVAGAAGVYSLGASADDGIRVFLDGKKVIDDWSEHAERQKNATVTLEQGRSYDLVVEYFQQAGGAAAHLLWGPPGAKTMDEAVAAARAADVVVMVLGISSSVENEEHDRDDIVLPSVQEALLKAVVATGKPVVLVYVNGGPVSSVWAERNLHAIVESWYGGEEAGTALASVLFGDVNPSGKLPVTVVRSLADIPDFADYDMSKRTYRYSTVPPLYPFGYGLSYTSFRYRGLKMPSQLLPGEPLALTANVTNTGARDGDEIVQVYVGYPDPKLEMPRRTLRAFRRIHLKAGESQEVAFTLSPADLAVVDGSGHFDTMLTTLDVSVGGGQPGFRNPTVGGQVKIVRKKTR